jgi:hypothetical protein
MSATFLRTDGPGAQAAQSNLRHRCHTPQAGSSFHQMGGNSRRVTMLRAATRNDPGDAGALLDSASALISVAERVDALGRRPVWRLLAPDIRYCLMETAVIGAANEAVMKRLASIQARFEACHASRPAG